MHFLTNLFWFVAALIVVLAVGVIFAVKIKARVAKLEADFEARVKRLEARVEAKVQARR
jgi:cell division protein FtsB